MSSTRHYHNQIQLCKEERATGNSTLCISRLFCPTVIFFVCAILVALNMNAAYAQQVISTITFDHGTAGAEPTDDELAAGWYGDKMGGSIDMHSNARGSGALTLSTTPLGGFWPVGSGTSPYALDYNTGIGKSIHMCVVWAKWWNSSPPPGPVIQFSFWFASDVPATATNCTTDDFFIVAGAQSHFANLDFYGPTYTGYNFEGNTLNPNEGLIAYYPGEWVQVVGQYPQTSQACTDRTNFSDCLRMRMYDVNGNMITDCVGDRCTADQYTDDSDGSKFNVIELGNGNSSCLPDGYRHQFRNVELCLSGCTAADFPLLQKRSASYDTTPPGALDTVNDGTGVDIVFTASCQELSANWTPSVDSQSPVFDYQYAIGSSPGATNVANWTSNGTALTATEIGLTLTDGTTYYFSVRARSEGGIGSVSSSNGQYVVATPPGITLQPKNVEIVSGQTATFSVSAVSGLPLSYQWQKNRIDIPAATDTSYTTPGVTTADDGARYRCIVTNSKGSVPSDEATLRVPTRINLFADDFNDGDANGWALTPADYWSVENGELKASGLTQANYSMQLAGITLSGGVSSIEMKMAVPNVYSFYKSGFTAINSDGTHALTLTLYGPWLYWQISTPGGESALREIVRIDGAFWSALHTCMIRLDADSTFSVLVDGVEKASGISCGLASAWTAGIMQLQLFTTANEAGTQINARFDDVSAFVYGIDTSSPVISNVTAGSLTATNAVISWTTNEGTTSQVEYGLTTSYGQSTTLNSSLVISHSVNLTGLTPLTLYHYCVGSADASGNASTGTDNTFTTTAPDTTPPSAPLQVRDGTGTDDASKTGSLMQLSANWDAAADSESGISGYKYTIGTSPGATNVAGWTTLGNVTTVTKTGLSLTIGSTYYFSVKAINGASPALESSATNSDGQYVRESSTEVVYLSGLAWASVTNGWGTVEKNMSNGEDSAGDGTTITLNGTTYTTGLGTHANSEIVYSLNGQYETFESVVGVDDEVGTNGSVTFEVWVDNVKKYDSGVMTGSSASQQVNVSVSGANTLKLVTSNGGNGNSYDHGDWADARLTAGSEPQVDTTPPSVPAAVNDGTGVDVDLTISTTQLSANWTAATDNESSISNYEYAIGTTAGATNITNGWLTNGMNLTVTRTGLTLVVGQTYYFSIRAVNGASTPLTGNVTNSDGQLVYDPSDPRPLITGVTATNINTNSITITWTTDKPATSQVEYGLTTGYGNSTISESALVTSHSVNITGLTEGTTYHYRVKSDDGLGDLATGTDNTFVTSRNIITPPQSAGMKAYPNPCDFSKGKMQFVINDNAGGSIKIYTIKGIPVRELISSSGIIEWDGANGNGEKIKRGIYIYKIKKANGDSITGRLAVR